MISSRRARPSRTPCAPANLSRISGTVTVKGGKCCYQLSILKSADGNPAECQRQFFDYPNPVAGEGHFIHTYSGDGDPIPSFEGEPERVEIGNAIDTVTNDLWNSLNEDNKVSLFVRFIDLETGDYETRIVNKNQ